MVEVPGLEVHSAELRNHHILDTGDGPSALLHLTTNIMDVTGEQFTADIDAVGSVIQIGEPRFKMKSAKLWEATVKLRVQDVAPMIPILLNLFPLFPEEIKAKIRAAVAEKT